LKNLSTNCWGAWGKVLGARVVTPPISRRKPPLPSPGPFQPYTGQREDLFLIAELPPHRFFQFDGTNLTAEVPITPDEAVLGAPIEVPTPDGSVTVTVPAGMRSGQVLRLRGKGWPQATGGRGDLLLKIQIVAPKDLSASERELYTKLANLRTFNPRTHLKGITL
jgi:curved DNA-binding protein